MPESQSHNLPAWSRGQLLGLNALIEFGLLAVSLWIGWMTGLNWWATDFQPRSLLVGCAAGILVAVAVNRIVLTSRAPFTSLKEDFSMVRQLFAPVHRRTDLLVISLMAGIGEESIFRGLLQPWLASQVPIAMAIAGTAILFGLCHLLSISYFFYASLIGGMLGCLAWASGDVWSAMTAHATYDFVLLCWAMKKAG